MTTVISVENVSKRYMLGALGSGTLAHDLNRAWARLRGKPDPLAKIGDETPVSSEQSTAGLVFTRSVHPSAFILPITSGRCAT